MRVLRDLSIRRKLTLITMTTTVVALVMACAAFLAYEVLTFRGKMARDLAILADVIGTNSTGALAFSDETAARDALSALQAQPNVVAACTSDKHGQPFARYARTGVEGAVVPESAGDEATVIGTSSIGVLRRVRLDGETIGTVFILSDLGEFQGRIRRYAIIMLAVLLTASLVALALARRIATNAPMSNFAVMHALPRIADQSQEQGLFTESLMAAVAESTPDAKDRLRAFLEGRANKVVKS